MAQDSSLATGGYFYFVQRYGLSFDYQKNLRPTRFIFRASKAADILRQWKIR
jgi:hypothetical protein